MKRFSPPIVLSFLLLSFFLFLAPAPDVHAASPIVASSVNFNDSTLGAWTQSGGPTLAYVDDGQGGQALSITRAADYEGIQSPTGVLEAGVEYTFSMRAMLAAGGPASTAIRFVVKPNYNWVANTTINDTGWTTISGTYTLPAGVDPATAQIYIGSTDQTGPYTILIDDILITRPVAVVTVSSVNFNDSTTGAWTQSGGPTLAYVDDGQGGQALSITRAADYEGIQSPTGVLEAGVEYTFSMRAMLAAGGPASTAIRFVVKPNYNWVANTTINDTGWTTISGTYTLPAGVDPATAQIYIGSTDQTGPYAILIDDILITTPDNFTPITISGLKFNDLDLDGIKEAGEGGLAGWIIELRDASDDHVITTATTAVTTGSYSFINLGRGNYRIREVQQAGWIQTTQNPADIVAQGGVDVPNINFGNAVNTTTTSITSASNPSLIGQPVTFTATVRRTSDNALLTSGAVAFTDNGMAIGGCNNQSLNVSGQATCGASSLAAGAHTVVAQYSDSIYGSSTCALSPDQLVVPTFGVSAMIVGQTTPQMLYAGQDGGGIWKSTDNGATWTEAAAQPSNKRIKGLVRSPADNTVFYAATYGGGVFKSTNSADNWSECANAGLAGPGLNATALAIDPTGNLFAGTEAGIFTSATCDLWTAVNSGLPISPATPPVSIVAAPATFYTGLDGAGVYRGFNIGSGIQWMAATTQPTNLRVKAIAIKLGDSTKLYAATYGGGVFASTDSGDTWAACVNTNLTNLNVGSLTIDGSGKLYAGTAAGVFVSTDGCATWTAMNAGLP